ncbi:MAG: MaoC domain protein dehydratase [Chloroflexi bacterium]|jgi:acyl dehydratase|nr:MaoC domain protein dehydratase [Chloroflexota bacterium]
MDTKIPLDKLKVGQSLPELRKRVTQENINLYARASGDYNPIHIDEEFARKTPAGGTIAHGMLILAYASQVMTEAFGKSWLTGGRFNVRFKAPARPGDTITVEAKIRNVQSDIEQTTVSCDVLCSNQKGETVISGEAVVRVRND